MRLIPMVEITVPYQAGHSRNLPVKAGWNGTLGATTPPLEEWLDMKVLEPYGVTVRYVDEAGNLGIYAPLSLVSDETGGASVAFATRVPYQAMAPRQLGQRPPGPLRLVAADARRPMQGGAPGRGRRELVRRARKPRGATQIVQTYDEAWVLSGFSVREDHGADLLIAYEDPAKGHDTDLRGRPATCRRWPRAWTRPGSRLATVTHWMPTDTCKGDGNRDLDIAEIKHRFDNTSNGDIPADDERLWGIPKTALKIFPGERRLPGPAGRRADDLHQGGPERELSEQRRGRDRGAAVDVHPRRALPHQNPR